MKDQFGRDIDYLRLSVTDLCNLRCRYCMPETGVQKLSHDDILSIEELTEIARAAISCGIYEGAPVLDLDYAEDSAALADTNFVLSADHRIVEIQASAEHAPFSEDAFNSLFALARKGAGELFEAQLTAVNTAEQP